MKVPHVLIRCAALICLLAGLSSAALAHDVRAAATAVVTGLISDGTANRPIAGATVTFNTTSTTTNAVGQYTVTVPAATSFRIMISAPQYTPATLTVGGVGGVLISGLQRIDFTGAAGLRPLDNMLHLIGVVADAQTGRPVPGAAVVAQGHDVFADATGHYSLTVPATAHTEVDVSALGYALRSPFVVAHADHSIVRGTVAINFSGSAGLRSAFRTAAGDMLSGVQQISPRCTKPLSFQVTTGRKLASVFAVTFPNGDAASIPLKILGGGRYSGQVPLSGLQGIYHLEINTSDGFALFDPPLYCGVPYVPLALRSEYPPDSVLLTPSQLESLALARINTMRAAFHRGPLALNPQLQQAARAHSSDVLTHGYYDQHPHVGSNGSLLPDRIKAVKVTFTAAGEDVGMAPSVAAALESMMFSPSHRFFLISTSFNTIGPGVARGADQNLILTTDCVRR